MSPVWVSVVASAEFDSTVYTCGPAGSFSATLITFNLVLIRRCHDRLSNAANFFGMGQLVSGGGRHRQSSGASRGCAASYRGRKLLRQTSRDQECERRRSIYHSTGVQYGAVPEWC